MKSFFSPKEVGRIQGMSYRQLVGWDKRNFVKPSYLRRGKYRLYTFSDMLLAWVAKGLFGMNEYRGKRIHSRKSVKRIIERLKNVLPRVTKPLVELTILIQGENVLVSEGAIRVEGNLPDDSIIFVVEDLRHKINELFPEPIPGVTCR